MSCFIGISITEELHTNSYTEVIREMEHYIIQAGFQILPSNNLLIISNGLQKFRITRNSLFLHSNLQHLMVVEKQDEDFIETIVQCLVILKQYFPSKIEIELVSDLEQIYNLQKMIEQQIPRRLAGHLKMLAENPAGKKLSMHEIDRLIFVLGDEIHKDYRHKLRILSLKILNQYKFAPQVWDQLNRTQIQIIDDIANDPIYQNVGIQVLQKIVRNNQIEQLSFSDAKENITPNNFIKLNEISKQNIKFDGIIDSKTAFFQLKQSMNISRICGIISMMLKQQLDQKQAKKFDSRVKIVCKKLLADAFPEISNGQYQELNKCLWEYIKLKQSGKTNQLFKNVFEYLQKKTKANPKKIDNSFSY